MAHSVFEETDARVESSMGNIKLGDEKIVFEGFLRVKDTQGEWTEEYFLLTNDKLIYCTHDTSQPLNVTSIRWKRVDPFMETDGAQTLFGFKITGPNEMYQEFYTKTSDELDTWLRMLGNRCICMQIYEDYSLIREIGKGNYATVFKARCLEDNKIVAIKQISKEAATKTSRSLTHLINEIDIMRTLEHPNCLRVHRIYEEETNVHLILDFADGGELFKRIIKRGRYSEKSASLFMRKLLETLVYLNKNFIVHRDIKPENILLKSEDDDTDFFLADFGLATFSGNATLQLKCGSPGYVAPEILNGQMYGQAVDVFSCGVLLYILLSGRTPFPGNVAKEVLNKNKECRIHFRKKYWKDISHQGLDLVLQLTDPDPRSRITAQDALKHEWFSMSHETTNVANYEVSDQDIIPPLTPGVPIMSHALMQRLAESKDHQHLRQFGQRNADQVTREPPPPVEEVKMQNPPPKRIAAATKALFNAL